MTRGKRILGAFAAFTLLAGTALAFAVRHDAPCGPPEPVAEGAERMLTVTARCYGGREVLRVEQAAKPVPGDNEVLVRVHAASLNPLDWYHMTGAPYLTRLPSGLGRPGNTRMGVDFAGTVEATGRDVTRYRPGDRVFGGRRGAFSGYIVIGEDRAIARMPDNLDFGQAAAAGVSAITALQALRDRGRVGPGSQVLINGASGGVGTFAVQIARHYGAEVTGVSSTRNLDLVRTLGADHAIDYTREDFTDGPMRYDVIVDNVGNRPLSELVRALKPDGTLVLVGGSNANRWIGPLSRPLKALLLSPFISQEVGMLFAEFDQGDLELLAGLMREGSLVPVIDRRYPLGQVGEAMAHLETGRARGKVILTLD